MKPMTKRLLSLGVAAVGLALSASAACAGAFELTLASGRGTALDFDGINDYVSVAGVGGALAGECSVEFWMKAHALKEQGVFNLLEVPSGTISLIEFRARLPRADGSVSWDWGLTPSRTLAYMPPVPLVGAWHHFALVSSVSGNYRRIYRNGILEAQSQFADGAPLSGQLVIGRYVSGGTNWFNGELDEFRVWTIARTQAQIQENLNDRLVGDEPGLAAYFRMDEGAGPVLVDASIHHRDGRIDGAVHIGSTAPVDLPVATTLSATSVGSGNATLNGSVNGEGTLASRYWFEYGVQSNLNLATPSQSLLPDTAAEMVSANVSNLQGGIIHTFRLVAANDNGTNYGVLQAFFMPFPASGYALRFNGSNYVKLGSSTLLKATTALSVEAWLYPTGPGQDAAANGGIIVNKEGEYEFARFADGTLRWALAINSPNDWKWVNTGIIAPSNQWMHVVFAYGGGAMKLYTNGVPASTNNATGTIGDAVPGLNELWIGQRQAGGQGFQGQIDEVRIWGTTRTATDVAGNYNQLLAGNEPGLLAYLHFDEGGGTTTLDSGPNRLVGALVNNPSFVASGAQPTSPLVNTLAPSPVLATSATLHGTVNPAGESATTFFEYGTTAAYGSPTTPQNYPGSLTTLSLSASLSGLEPGTTYHYRMVAYNTLRTNYGANQTFTTLVLGSGWPVSTKLTGGEASSPVHVLDGLGNTYVAGVFSGSATFRSPLSPAGGANANAFVGKMSRSADWLWAVNIPASVGGFTLIKAMATDTDRNVYVAGQFSGTNTFGSRQLVSLNDTNLFVAKLDGNGTNWLWAKAAGGAGPDSANALAVVGTNVLVAGNFWGTATNFASSNLVSAGGSDVFVGSLDSTSGTWLWANRGGGASNDMATTLAVDTSTNIYVAGQYAGTNAFGTNVLANAGGVDLFVAKLTRGGAWVLARRGGSANNDAATALMRDAGNQIYLLGQFGGTANFGGTVDNLNVGNSTNLFVLKLDTEALYQGYSQAGVQGGLASARAMTVDSLGRVYVSGQFNFGISFGTNTLNSSGNSDIFVAQMVDGDWTWAQSVGAAGTETAGSLSADADNSVVLSGTYQGTIKLGYVALSSPNNQDIFVARFDTNRVYEHNNYIVGQPIPVPLDAQDEDYGDGALGQPVITILEKDQSDSDALNSFVWSIAQHKLFPVRQVVAVFKWPLTTNPTNTTAVVTAVGRSRFPAHPQIHIASAPAELEPNVAGFPLKFLNLSFTTVPGANVDAGTKQFQAAQPGWSVIQLLDTGGEIPNPTLHRSVFEVVKTVLWNDPAYLRDNQPAVIGTALSHPAHHDPTGKNGYVFFERAFYDGVGDERAYDRPSRTGPILPVNKDTGATNDDLVVIWYDTNSVTGIGWPDKPVRYSASWPTNAEELVLASGAGSGVLSPLDFPSMRVYNQPDATLPGYNPNEEHAALYGSTLYALRNDLNAGIGVSEPFVLLKHQEPADGQWAMKVFKVLTTNATFNFVYSGEAGQELLLPPPLSLLSLCGHSNQLVSGPGFKDVYGRLYARAAGSNSSGAVVVARYSYPLQPGFFYDLDRNGQPDAPVGTCVPWLDRRAGGAAGQAIELTYNITWPANAPVLQIGETLLGAKLGLPDIRSFASAQVIFDQANPDDTNALRSLARLFDPLSERTLQLPEDFVLPSAIGTALQGARKVFTGLPYAIRSRLLYDELTKQLSFRGLLDEDAHYGGPDNPLLLLNVMSPRERDRIKLLDGDGAFTDAIDELYELTRNPNRLDINPKDGTPDKSLLVGLQYEVRPDGTTNVNSVVHEKLGDVVKALTAGPGTGSGFVTIVKNNDAALAGLPVSLHVIRVDSGPFRGDLKVILPDNVFDEKLTIRHSADFGGEPQRFEFEWYYQPDHDGFVQTQLPTVLPDGQIELHGWIRYTEVPSGINGVNDITFGDGGESGLLVLADNWVICRYRGYVINGQTNWSDWVGAMGGGRAQLAEGWVKRVRDRLGPFEARTTNFHASESITFASMLQQAGTRHESDIAFNPDADNINNVGLIEAYETVLRRARRLSIDGAPPVNYQPANDALLLAAGFIADLYLLLGNEAYADAADPTIGFRTSSAGYGTLAPSIFTFQNQLDSLLEEELALLRGRDARSATVRAAPVYNRLFWNFTRDDGEVAYAQAYNITDQNNDGLIDANDARIMYPQGHGDAWGHYLTATKTYYALLQNPQFDWKPRTESILLAGVPVDVDYLDERKFARAAAAKAKTGAEIVDLSYRLSYVDDPAGQFQGYKDTDPNRAWGLSEWGHRAGSAALFDWVLANAILPAVDPNTNHVGIEKIDRITVSELDEILAGYEAVQSQVNKADAGLNPLGLAKNVVPFDIDPAQISAGKTHFEQIYDRALEAMNNTVTVFNHANQLSQALRALQDSVNSFSQQADEQERDFKNRLLEVFGYPYAGDIGAGRTYPSGYDGPDLYHYMYVNTLELNGDTAPVSEAFTAFFQPKLGLNTERPLSYSSFQEVKASFGSGDFFFPDDAPGDPGDRLAAGSLLQVSYPYSAADYGFTAPASWGQRRAPGEIQLALSDLLQSEARFKQAHLNYDNLIQKIDAQLDLLQARYALERDKIYIENRATQKKVALSLTQGAAKLVGRILGESRDTLKKAADAVKEGMPKVVGTATDCFSAIRAAISVSKTAVDRGLRIAQNIAGAVEEKMKEAKEDLRDATALEVDRAGFPLEVQQQLAVIEELSRDEAGLRVEAFTQREVLAQSAGKYQAAVAKGLRLLDERTAFRKNAAADTQASRYQDMTFRIFRNDAIQKYRAQYDLAAQYVFLAAVAYDYETQLLGGRAGAGRAFLTDIVKQRGLGELLNGVPVAGRHGLADPLGRLNQNFGVLKGQLGFNNPQTETGRFSLRNEFLRLRSTSDEEWQAELKKRIVPNLWNVPEFRRYCRPFAPESAGAQPGLVIRFPTTVTFGLNYFGWPLGGGDNAYDPTLFATKIRSAGIWFSNYNANGLSLTPRVYLVPAGADVMRSPSGNNLETREWRVVDQKIPVPFPIGFSSLNNSTWIPMNDSLSDTFADIRRFSSFRAYHDKGTFDPAETVTDSRLIGRSVWNTDWMLIIPGGTFLFDPNQGLEAFINSVSDIKIFFQTYAYSGN
jgi:hypothetical protein